MPGPLLKLKDDDKMQVQLLINGIETRDNQINDLKTALKRSHWERWLLERCLNDLSDFGISETFHIHLHVVISCPNNLFYNWVNFIMSVIQMAEIEYLKCRGIQTQTSCTDTNEPACMGSFAGCALPKLRTIKDTAMGDALSLIETLMNSPTANRS